MRDLTVVVSAPGSCASLERCLRALAAQTLPADRFEVVVVLHGPGEAAREGLKRTLEGPLAGHDVVLADAVAPTSAAARNVGVELARGSWTTLVDGRDVPGPDLLEALHTSRSTERVAAARVEQAGAGHEPAPDAGPTTAPHRAVGLARARGGFLVPTAWLREVPWVDALAEHADAVRAGALLSRFDHRFTTVDPTPALRGATYAVSPDAPDARPLLPDVVRDRVAALEAMTAGTQADPADRSALTDALVDAELADLRRDVAGDPDATALADRLLRAAGIRGVRGLGTTTSHDDTWSLFREPDDAVRSVVVVAGSAGAVNGHARMLTFLSRNGVGVRVVHYSGRLKPMLRLLPDAHSVEVLPASSGWLESRLAGTRSRRRRIAVRAAEEALRVGRRVVPEVLPPRVTAPAWRRVDQRAADLVTEPGTVVVLDRGGSTLLRACATSGSVPAAGDLHDLAVTVMRVAASRVGGHLQDAHAARGASRVLRREPTRTRSWLDARLWAMVGYRLLRSNRLEAAEQVLDDLGAIFGADALDRHGVPALRALIDVQTGRARDTGSVVDAVRAALGEGDAALAGTDGSPDDATLDEVAFLATVALDVLFTRRLHAAVTTTPLVDDPDTFLAPLRDTATGRLLAAPAPRRDVATPPAAVGPRPRVTVLPGAYPKFAKAVVEQLTPAADVEVLDLGARESRFTNTGIDPRTVRARLLAATGQAPALDPATAEALTADVVFVDWADKGLTWATDVVPEGTRVVVRLHGVDTLSAWLHTADWSRVTDAIFPSEHLRRAAANALGGRLDGVRQHVVANPVDVDRYVLPKHPSARKRLGMVGWAQQVKDPQWTLDVLAELRRHDPEWRLALIGADVDLRAGNPVERELAQAFHARLAADPDLHDGIDYVGYTSALPERLRDVGWAVSASRREGFHVGLVEMAASGAVPVVRDWPVYAREGGAGLLYPTDWVVTTPAEAATRILAVTDAGAWDDESAGTVDTVRKRFSGSDAGARLREIVLRNG
ncbi:glycosyltransferase [Intrasporangium sp. YIM S08009]|uniref:glycosyltransferase n=1 Tax=Intrasporangium zincisolvens TaxID=3080018 RepID=UPI002B056C7B|nr:glycosyltransferase [Intrasporangium sp. YIM S08009]